MRRLSTDQMPTREVAAGRGISLVISGVFLWSLAGVIVRSVESATELQVIFFRAIAMLCVALIALKLQANISLKRLFLAARWYAPLAGFFGALSSIFFIFSLSYTTVAQNAFIMASVPMISALLGWVLLGERVKKHTWIAILIAFVGIGVMVSAELQVGGGFGALLAFLSALCFALYVLVCRAFSAYANMLPSVFYMALITVLLSFVAIKSTGGDLQAPLEDLYWCLLLGVVQVGLGNLLFTAGARYLPAAETTLLGYIEVILSPLWVWLVYQEQPSDATLLGGVFIFLAVVTQTLMGMRHQRAMAAVHGT